MKSRLPGLFAAAAAGAALSVAITSLSAIAADKQATHSRGPDTCQELLGVRADLAEIRVELLDLHTIKESLGDQANSLSSQNQALQFIGTDLITVRSEVSAIDARLMVR